MAEEYLRVRDWDRFQFYRFKNPDWICLHSTLLSPKDSRAFYSLTEVERYQLMMIWLLASRTQNHIENDPESIRLELRFDTAPPISKFIEVGVLVVKTPKEVRDHDAIIQNQNAAKEARKAHKKAMRQPSSGDVPATFPEHDGDVPGTCRGSSRDVPEMFQPIVHSTQYKDHIDLQKDSLEEGSGHGPASPLPAASPAAVSAPNDAQHAEQARPTINQSPVVESPYPNSESAPGASYAPLDPILFTAKCKGSPATVGVSRSSVEEYINAGDGHSYRSIDVLHEISAAVAWLDANESKRWTAKGFRAGLARWLKSAIENKPLARDDAACRESYRRYKSIWPEATTEWLKAACMSATEAERIKQGGASPTPRANGYQNGPSGGAAPGPKRDYLSVQIEADAKHQAMIDAEEAQAKRAYAARKRGPGETESAADVAEGIIAGVTVAPGIGYPEVEEE